MDSADRSSPRMVASACAAAPELYLAPLGVRQSPRSGTPAPSSPTRPRRSGQPAALAPGRVRRVQRGLLGVDVHRAERVAGPGGVRVVVVITRVGDAVVAEARDIRSGAGDHADPV